MFRAFSGRSSSLLVRLAEGGGLPVATLFPLAGKFVLHPIGKFGFRSWSVSREQPLGKYLLPKAQLTTFKNKLDKTVVRNSHSASSKNIVPLILSDIGEGTSEVEIKDWLVKVGDTIKQFDGVCEVESDKTTATISSRYDGVITKIHYQVGDLAKVGKPLIDIEVSGGELASQTTPSNEAESQRQSTSKSSNDAQGRQARETSLSSAPIATLPSVRRMAKEHGIDLSAVIATGRHGQILKEDLLAYLQNQEKLGAQTTGKPDSSPASHPQAQPGIRHKVDNIELETVVPLRGIKRAMHKTMTRSLMIPHFNYSEEIDLTQLTDSIRRHRERDAQNKVGVFAYMIKMVSLALRDYPELNASLDPSGEFMVYKHFHNIGIAVDTQAGLVVPNIKNVQNLSVNDVQAELTRLRELGYSGKLGQNDLSGGTISLSNIGAIGGIFGVPVIVSPEIVIGAIGRTQKLPRFDEQGQVEARQIMQVVWSADHRVVDGATLSRFSNLLKLYLEEPATALLRLS